MTPLSQFEAHWPAISALLDEALSLPAPEHASWLQGLVGERALHREALRALLAHQAQVETDDFLNALPRLDAADAAPSLGRLAAGSSVGAYRLIEEIGQGGMGTVWLAERADALMNRRVALKLPRIVWGDTFAERLAREREILATLEHEHIARLYDAGIDAHGRPFLAMEHVDGEPIDAYCRTHALPVRERVALLLQVMAAVSHAHSRLVVHRDLKPSNILVTGEAKVKLLDFGIAKLLEGDSTLRTALTELSGRALTLDYASPEQIRGEPLGTVSDVYSMGVVAFEVLADARPYRLKRGTAAEMEEAIASAEPRQASDAATAPASRKALRGDLDAILNRALKKAVVERYPSIDALAQDLERHLRGEPVQARPDRLGYRVAKFIGRHRLGTAATAALAASIVAGTLVSVWQARLAKQETQRALGEVLRQTAVRDLYLDTLARVSTLAQEHPEALARPGAVTSIMLERLREVAPLYANDPRARGGQYQAAIVQLGAANRIEEAIALITEYLDLLKRSNGPPKDLIWAYTELGRDLARVERFDEAEAVRRSGASVNPGSDDIETESERVFLLADIGDLLSKRGSRDEAIKAFMQIDALSKRLPELADHEFFSLRGLGVLNLGVNDSLALTYLRQARAALAAKNSAPSTELANTRGPLGDALLANGEADQAEREFIDVVAHYRRRSGRNAASSLRSFGRLTAVVARRDPARALAMLDDETKALSALPGGVSPQADQVLGARRLEVAWLIGDTSAAVAASPEETRKPLAVLMDEPGQLSIAASRLLILQGRAGNALQRMQALRARLPTGDKPSVPWLVVTPALLEAQVAAGQPADAKRTADALLQFFEGEHAQGGHEYRTAAALGALATARAGDRDGAARLLARLAQAKPPPFPSAVERAQCELYRAQALAETGQGAAAAEVARAALPDLAGQNPSSPRLALAKRLIASGAVQ